MRTRLLVACFSLALTACVTEPFPSSGGEEATGPASTADVEAALAALPEAEVLGTHEDGLPYMIRGRLGSAGPLRRDIPAPEVRERAGRVLEGLAPVFRLNASELVFRRVDWDTQGHAHLRYGQTRNGLPVVGQELLLHVDPEGTVYAANGSARDGEHVPARARLSAEAARFAALEATPGGVQAEEAPRLVYVRSRADGRLKLAFEVMVKGEQPDTTPIQDHVFVEALEGGIVERSSDIHAALYRMVYSANNGTALPGTLKKREGGFSSLDQHVEDNYGRLGLTYNCFKSNFGRDSYDGAGAQLKSSVHYSANYSNAFWNGLQFVFGDGDGVQSGPLGKSLDVTAHEYTHAVAESIKLGFASGEPAALHESMGDVFAAYCESWTKGWGTGATVWMIGDDVWTPATAGDALRYMANPAQDGLSKDYYPERYTGTASNGMYWNAGISNLAFMLMSTGGTHPRGRTAITVPGIGVQNAGAIFYQAYMNYFTDDTGFAQARLYTEQAAIQLFGKGSLEQDAVSLGWQAVGVSRPSIALTNGVAKTGLSGARGSSLQYYLDVPASRPVRFSLNGGTGDADLYVRSGEAPTLTSYDCRPWLDGNTETCDMPAKPTAGRYHVMVIGYNSFSGVSLRGDYDATPPVTTITSAPQSFTRDKNAELTFSADEAPVTFTCSLNGVTTTPCYSPVSHPNLADGEYVFSVFATDGVGNVGQAATRTWQVDTRAPHTDLVDSPVSHTNSTGATFKFIVNDLNVLGFECRLDTPDYTPCDTLPTPWPPTYQVIYSGLADGSHTFGVRAIDAAGNVGPETTHTWVVDTVAPITVIHSAPPSPTNDRTVEFEFAVNEDVPLEFIECKLDAEDYGPCSVVTSPSPSSYKVVYVYLPDGPHAFSVRARDLAGNMSLEESHTWVVDTVVPVVSLQSAPPSPSSSTTATFQFSASEASAVFTECSLDGAAHSLCTSPITYPSLADGTRVFSVRARDLAGNMSEEVIYSWVVNTGPPPCGISEQLLANAGFESGNAGWTASSSDIISPNDARTGIWKAKLNGYGSANLGTLYQQVTLPSTACTATFSFWLKISTFEDSSALTKDKLEVQVRNSSGAVLGTLASLSSQSDTSGTYVQRSYDLSAYKGQTIRVFFRGEENDSLETSFFIDDTALTITR